MENEQFVICYINNQGNRQYTTCNDPKYIVNSIFDVELYLHDNPGMHIRAVFKDNDNLMSVYNHEKEIFYRNCTCYGFDFDDYRKPVIDTTGTEYIFLGLLPNNHKYKALLLRKSDGRRIKATTDFVHRFLLQ